MIVTMGEMLVDILAEERGQSFRVPGRLLGPFPGGAPATFIAQVARLGEKAGIVSCIGDDDFGWLVADRLRREGVDLGAVRVDPEQVTASAFVRYRDDGDRDFLFNLKRSASGRIELNETAERMLAACSHFHIMGSSLFSFRVIDEIQKAMAIARENGAVISFDPNVRKEMLGIPEMRAGLELMLRSCDIFMPSGPEMMLPADARSVEEAMDSLFEAGVRMVVLKRSREGSSYYDRERTIHMPAFPTEEADPTGAGDCFGAAFVTCLRRGMDVEDCLRYANAAGAMAVSRKGGMEGIAGFDELDALIAGGARQAS